LYVAVAVAVATSLVCALRLWTKDLGVPLSYSGDGLFWMILVNAISEDGLAGHFGRLGAPFGLDIADWPLGMPLDLSIMRLLAWATGSAGMALNLYWLASVVVTGVVAAFVFRRLAFSRAMAFWLGVLFALLPYSFMRNISHVALVYHFVPLLSLLCVRLAAGAAMPRAERGVVLAAAALQGLSYIYYTFFAAVLVTVAWAIGTLRTRSRAGLGIATVALAALALGTAVSMAPSVLYWRAHGRNTQLQYKSPNEADYYGLKIRQLLLPIPDHPIAAFRRVDTVVRAAQFPLENENTSARLGGTASVGFVVMLGAAMLAVAGVAYAPALVQAAGALLLFSVLWATIGGFGSLFNVFALPDFRAYNRMVVFIAFFSLIGLGAMVEALRRRLLGPRSIHPAAAAVAAAVTTAAAVWDQATTADLVPRYAADDAQFAREQGFVAEVESALPEGAMVFQLPHTEFPVDPGRESMLAYDQGRPFVHSRTLRWSWGGLSGRNGDWSRRTAELEPDALARVLALTGFSGIWIDRFGYADGGRALEESLRPHADGPSRASPDGRYFFLDMRRLREATEAAVPDGQLPHVRARLLAPLKVRWERGFYAEEANGVRNWRWCRRRGRVTIENGLAEPRRVRLRARLGGGLAQPYPLDISTGGTVDTLALANQPVPFERVITIGPGETVAIDFAFRGPRYDAPSDSRRLFFALFDFSATDVIETRDGAWEL